MLIFIEKLLSFQNNDAWNPALDIQKAEYRKTIYLFPKALSTVFLSQKASEYYKGNPLYIRSYQFIR